MAHVSQCASLNIYQPTSYYHMRTRISQYCSGTLSSTGRDTRCGRTGNIPGLQSGSALLHGAIQLSRIISCKYNSMINNGSNIIKPCALAHGFMILEPLFKNRTNKYIITLITSYYGNSRYQNSGGSCIQNSLQPCFPFVTTSSSSSCDMQPSLYASVSQTHTSTILI